MNIASSVISGFTNNFEKLEFTYDFGRAICHNQEDRSPHFSSKMHAKSNLFAMAEGVTIVVNGIFLLIQLERNYRYISRFYNFVGWWFTFTANTFIAIAIPVTATVLLNKCILKPIIVDAKSYKVKNNEIQMMITVAKIALNIGLFAFSPTNPFYALNVGLELYALAKVARRKWVVLTQTIQRDLEIINGQGPFNVVSNQMRVNFEFLIRNDFNKNEDDCAICMEPNPETFFCDNHKFHLSCIVNAINARSDSLARSINITARNVIETRHTRNDQYTHSTFRAVYYGDVKKSAVACCSLCRVTPNHNKFIVTIDDRQYGASATIINWKDD